MTVNLVALTLTFFASDGLDGSWPYLMEERIGSIQVLGCWTDKVCNPSILGIV